MEPNSRRYITYEFEDFQLDTRQMMLFRRGEEVSLPPKAVETLIALIERRGAIVSRDELFTVIWQETVVEESNLSRYVHLLRSTLGRRADGSQYIETFRRRGYRFNSEVRVKEPATTPLSNHTALPEASTSPSLDFHDVSQGNVRKVTDWHPLIKSDHEVFVPVRVRPIQRHRSRRVTLYSFGGIVIVAALLYFVGTRQAPPLTDRDFVLIAEFENRTGEQIFDGTLTQGLAIQLQQSPFLGIFPDVAVHDTLRLMKKPVNTIITRQIASEICQRKAIKAYIVGTISPVGTSYLITVEAIDGATGEVIASQQAEAAGRESVIAALSSAAVSLRETLGESLASISKRTTSLEVTTSSLEALKMYTLARDQLNKPDYQQARIFLQRAVEIDPEFAIAYADQAIPYQHLGQYSLAEEAATKAFSMADRVSDYERLQITDTYHASVTFDLDERIKNLTLSRELYPRDVRVLFRLGNLMLFTAEYEKAKEISEEALAGGATRAIRDIAAALVAMGRNEEARVFIDSRLGTAPDKAGLFRLLAEIAVATGDGELLARARTGLSEESPQMYMALEAEIAAMEGRFSDSQRFFDDAVSIAEKNGGVEQAVLLRASKMRVAAILKRCSEAEKIFLTIKDSLDIRLVPAASANSFAICGNEVRAEAALDTLFQQLPQGTIANRVVTPTVRGFNALNSGDPRTALSILNRVPRGLEQRNNFYSLYVRGYAFLETGNPSKAIEEFETIISRRSEALIDPIYPLALLGVARARVKMGDNEGAHSAYEAFFEMWKDADRDIPELNAARAELAILSTKTPPTK